jgi:hypothetical protein
MTFDDEWVEEVKRGFKACAVFCWFPIYFGFGSLFFLSFRFSCFVSLSFVVVPDIAPFPFPFLFRDYVCVPPHTNHSTHLAGLAYDRIDNNLISKAATMTVNSPERRPLQSYLDPFALIIFMPSYTLSLHV